MSPGLFCEYSFKLFSIIIKFSSVLFHHSAESDIPGVLHIWAQHLSQLTFFQTFVSIALQLTVVKSLKKCDPLDVRASTACVGLGPSVGILITSGGQRAEQRARGGGLHPAQAKHGTEEIRAALNTRLTIADQHLNAA